MMKIFLIGYGKMGKRIAELAPSIGVEISGYSTSSTKDFTLSAGFEECDGVIEFTRPESALKNLTKVLQHNKWMVSGTTGWEDDLPSFRHTVRASNGRFFYASNFSKGAFITFELNKVLASWMSGLEDYKAGMKEIHHKEKLDKPSGTAKTLANGIIDHHNSYNNWKLEGGSDSDIHIECEREEGVKGIHEVKYHNTIDEIMIRHEAYSRDGFVLGALQAALWLGAQNPGCYGMADMLRIQS